MQLDNNICSTALDYFSRIGINEESIDFDDTSNPDLIPIHEYEAIAKIIALQVSFWCLRRLSNSCQSNTDYLMEIIKEKIEDYSILYSKEFQNFNEELIW
jgi:hypothetical protein